MGLEPPEPGQQSVARKIIRSGEIEFEVDSFYEAVDTITRLVKGIKGAFVATVNSEKLANGKTRGSIAVRVPPATASARSLPERMCGKSELIAPTVKLISPASSAGTMPPAPLYGTCTMSMPVLALSSSAAR